ncbi:sodium-dependent phosphate transport protein 1 isoform X2 [Bubalus kerabau]|uniref:sodium-dependent phosphate transport protein 1 isoform X2 n=1 Tax=Bubalus carabanensis TaxID=3119969 RepID=UPI00244E8DF6|nr:sodium-dependent phosphate transport protein 1 isoform X2 [Bubalus carabanensis]
MEETLGIENKLFSKKKNNHNTIMQVDNQVSPGKVPYFCSIRYGIAFFLLLCNVIIMSQRVCLSLTMIAMVNSTEPHGLSNTSTKALQDNIKNPVYNWSTEIQGIMLSSIFYGVLISQIPAGYLSGIYSLKKMIGFALLLSSLFTLLLPLAAEFGEILVIICRVIKGLSQGITLTTQQVIWIKWAPPLELGRLTSLSLSGLLLGPCVVLLITGFICDSLGWPMVFYIFGACGCALSVLWFILFYEDPKDHPYISNREKEYITSALTQQVSSSTLIKVPIKAMLKSTPLWVISLCNFAFFWSNTFLSIYTPIYIDYKLHVDVKENGLLSSLPHLFAWIFAVLAGYMADIFQTRNTFSLVTIRKLFTSLGLLLPSLFSLCLLYLNSNYYATIIFLILANSTGSFAMGGLMINVLDIAPRYYGFLRGITNVIGLTGGLISSTVTGIILSEDAESPWLKIFLLMIANNMISLIFYLIFAKAEVQDWAKERQNTYL